MGLRTFWADFKRSFGATIAAQNGGYGQFVDFGNEYAEETDAEDYLRLSPAVYMACRYRAQKLASVPLILKRVGKGGAKNPVIAGTLVELLSKVNPYWTAARLLEMTEMSLLLRGSSYWLLDRGQGRSRREPREIWWLNPDNVKVLRGGDYIKSFEYDTGSGRPLELAPDEIVWFRYPNPANQWAGLSPLDAARIVADTGSAALQSNRRMFSQGMQLAGFVAPADKEDTWSKEQGAEIEASLQRRFSGANKAHRWAVLGRQMTFQALTLSPKDIEFVALLKWSFEDICRVFGLSPDLLGGERTYANAAEARLAFWQDTMMPECSFFANELTEQLLPLFPGQADVAEFDLSGVDVLQEREEAKWGRIKEQIATGYTTINRELAKVGEKPVAWGDDWWAPVSLVPVGGPIADAEARLAEEAMQPPPQLPPADDPKALPAGDEPKRARRRRRSLEFGGAEHERVWRAFTARTAPHEERFGRMCADLMRRQRQSILAKLRGERGQRDVAEIADDPFDKPKWIKQFRQGAKPVLREIARDAGDAALTDLALGIGFDVSDPAVVRFLTQRAQRFAVAVNETTWDALKASLAEGIDAGEGIPELSARVETVMAGRIRSSVEVIARTEVLGAASGADNLSWSQSGVVAGSEWVAALDERTRPTHTDAHGQRRALNDDFLVGDASGPGPGQMGDPAEDCNCRCTRVAILDTDWTGPS